MENKLIAGYFGYFGYSLDSIISYEIEDDILKLKYDFIDTGFYPWRQYYMMKIKD